MDLNVVSYASFLAKPDNFKVKVRYFRISHLATLLWGFHLIKAAETNRTKITSGIIMVGLPMPDVMLHLSGNAAALLVLLWFDVAVKNSKWKPPRGRDGDREPPAAERNDSLAEEIDCCPSTFTTLNRYPGTGRRETRIM